MSSFFLNFILILFGLSIFVACDPERLGEEDYFISNTDFIVSPDTSEIRINDTIWIAFEASNVFTASTGRFKVVSDVDANMPIWVYRINTGSTWIRASILDCGYVPIDGNYTTHAGTNSISYFTPIYYNNKYHFKMGFVPHVADTFFIQVKSSIEQKKRRSI